MMTGESTPAATKSAGPSAPLLSVENLRTWFELRRWGLLRAGSVRAVDGVSFELRRGEAVAVVGESGCGKSTLARSLLGLNRPSGGKVRLAGRVIGSRGDRSVAASMGYVQQDPYGALAPFMDVRRILAEPLIVHGVGGRDERESRVRRVLEEVRLSPAAEYLGKFPHMLSGGQQQRVVIARALILDPLLLVADEPVSMLDASVRVEILDLLRGIQQTRGLALMLITHDLATVRHFADRALVMYAGRIVETAGVDALLEYPQHPYTQALLGASADIDAANARRQRAVPPGEPPSLLNPPPGCRFHPRCAHAMAGRCDRDEPPMFEPRPGHRSACWLRASGKILTEMSR